MREIVKAFSFYLPTDRQTRLGIDASSRSIKTYFKQEKPLNANKIVRTAVIIHTIIEQTY